MATTLMADGRSGVVDPEKGRRFSLAEMQKAVGGFIEFVRLADDEVMVVNEEGLPRHLPPNMAASVIARRPIVGDVLVCKRKEAY